MIKFCKIFAWIFIFVLMLGSCSIRQSNNENSLPNASDVGQPQDIASAILFEEKPIASANNTFIVLDASSNSYGLMDEKGDEILPCQYGKLKYLPINRYEPKTYLAVKDKGSFGVYDLDGNKIIEPEYDDIEGAEYADCFLVEQHGKYGVIDLSGNVVLPVLYNAVDCSAQQMLAGCMGTGKVGSVVLQKYGSENESITFTTEGSYGITFSNWGSAITVWTESSGGGFFGDGAGYSHRYDLEGNELRLAQGNTDRSTFNNYFFYINGSTLSIIEGATGNTVISTNIGAERLALGKTDLQVDQATGEMNGVISIYAFAEDYQSAEEIFYLVQLGNAPALNYYDTLTSYGETIYADLGPFYNGVAYEISNEAQLNLLAIDGTRTELNVPFSYTEYSIGSGSVHLSGIETKSELLEGCAIMENNGYIYVINQKGETILSDSGYVSMEHTASSNGLCVLTTADGLEQVIDTYGNEIIPLGNQFESVWLTDVDGNEMYDYSCLHDLTIDQYYFVLNKYSRVMEPIDSIPKEMINQLYSGNGWGFVDADNQVLYVVIPDEANYKLYAAAELSSQITTAEITPNTSFEPEVFASSTDTQQGEQSEEQWEEDTAWTFRYLFGLSPQMIIVCIGIVAIILLIVIIIILTARSRKRKRRRLVPPQPVSRQKDDTPVLFNQLDQTELLWEDNVDQTNSDSEAPAMTLVLTDLSDPSRKYGAPVRGIIPIGRDISVCRIVINYDPSVARHQCDVFLEDGKLMLRNRSHSNITQVDGQRVEDKCPLQSGSILKMGRVQMRVEIM